MAACLAVVSLDRFVSGPGSPHSYCPFAGFWVLGWAEARFIK